MSAAPTSSIPPANSVGARRRTPARGDRRRRPQAGTKLRQVEIARRFGVSTTPVREALAALQREGLVRLHPQRGAVVFVPTVEDLREHYEIRAALEAWPRRARPSASSRLGRRALETCWTR